jgi:hypothetical protein
MNIRDLEEVNFFYRLHAREFEKGMEAARNLNTAEYNACKDRMRIISLRFKRARVGYYQRLKA